MEEFFTQLGNLLQGLFALAETGFCGVNEVIGLIIAAVFGLFLMGAWRGLWSAALGGVLVHTLVEVLRPMLDGGAFAFPLLTEMSFGMTRFALFLGYAVIAVFYFSKTLLGGGRHHRRAHAH